MDEHALKSDIISVRSRTQPKLGGRSQANCLIITKYPHSIGWEDGKKKVCSHKKTEGRKIRTNN